MHIIIISLLMVWGLWAHGDLKMVSGWVSDVREGIRPTLSGCLLTLASIVRKASGVCAPGVVGILTPPLHLAAPHVLFVWVGGVFFRFCGARKESRSMPCGRQGIINSACARLSRAVPPLRNNYLMCRLKKPMKSSRVPPPPLCTWDA
jgi:hypothetical protein